jgi:hypothetical protein
VHNFGYVELTREGRPMRKAKKETGSKVIFPLWTKKSIANIAIFIFFWFEGACFDLL